MSTTCHQTVKLFSICGTQHLIDSEVMPKVRMLFVRMVPMTSQRGLGSILKRIKTRDTPQSTNNNASDRAYPIIILN